MESSKDYTITAADGEVAMALASRCQVLWFKPTTEYVVYRK
jgi:hypothetical protein